MLQIILVALVSFEGYDSAIDTINWLEWNYSNLK